MLILKDILAAEDHKGGLNIKIIYVKIAIFFPRTDEYNTCTIDYIKSLYFPSCVTSD